MGLFRRFLADERGQDLFEYTILMALVAIVGAAVFAMVGTSVDTVWHKGNTVLANAVTAAS